MAGTDSPTLGQHRIEGSLLVHAKCQTPNASCCTSMLRAEVEQAPLRIDRGLGNLGRILVDRSYRKRSGSPRAKQIFCLFLSRQESRGDCLGKRLEYFHMRKR